MRGHGAASIRTAPTTALAYRIEEGGALVRLRVSDAGYPDGRAAAPTAIALYRGADVLLHDSTYTPEDRATRARPRLLVDTRTRRSAAVAREVKKLVMFHYDQDYSDDMVDALGERARRLLDEDGGKRSSSWPRAKASSSRFEPPRARLPKDASGVDCAASLKIGRFMASSSA